MPVARSTPVTSSKKNPAIYRQNGGVYRGIFAFLCVVKRPESVTDWQVRLCRHSSSHKKIPPETAKIVIWWDFYVIVCRCAARTFSPSAKTGIPGAFTLRQWGRFKPAQLAAIQSAQRLTGGVRQRAGTARHIAHVNDRGQDADTGLHQEGGGNAAARHDQVLGFVCDHAAVRDLVVIPVLVGVLVEQSLLVGVHINVPVPLTRPSGKRACRV